MGKKNKKMKQIERVLKWIFFIVAIPILLVSLIIMYKANKYPDKIPDVLGYKPMIVLSGSMETRIYTGDLVFVKMIDIDSLRENDIIAFRNETDTVTTHRIIEIIEENGEKLFRTKGDNNSAEDANLVKEGEIEGIYVFKISGLGNFLMFLQEPTGLAVSLLIILVVGFMWLYFADKLDEKKLREEDQKYRKEFEEFKRMQQEKREK